MLRRNPEAHDVSYSLKTHDHMAFLCGRPEHWRKLVSSFFQGGLVSNQRCLYLNGLYHPQQVYSLLDQAGLPVGEARLSGRLTILPATDFFLSQGCVDPQSALAKLRQEVTRAHDCGCSELRLLVDMNWATYFYNGLSEALACEALLNDLFIPQQACLAVCHYERVLFPPSLLKLVSAQHRSVLDGDRLLPLSSAPLPPGPPRPWQARAQALAQAH